MVSDKDEEAVTECPVCDKKIPLDAKTCPGCGADFSISGMEDLEAVATELTQVEVAPSLPKVEVKVQKEPTHPEKRPMEVVAPPKDDGQESSVEAILPEVSPLRVGPAKESPSKEDEKKGGLFKRFFGKK